MKSFPWPFIRKRHNDAHRTLSIPRRLGHQDVVFTGILYIKGKVARGIGILYKGRPCFSLETMRMLYTAFVYPYFTYCIEVWGIAYQSYLEPLVKLQKRAVRTITGARKYEHTLPLFQNFNLLNIKEIYILCATIDV